MKKSDGTAPGPIKTNKNIAQTRALRGSLLVITQIMKQGCNEKCSEIRIINIQIDRFPATRDSSKSIFYQVYLHRYSNNLFVYVPGALIPPELTVIIVQISPFT